MNYAYEKLMQKHGLTMKDLPEDALHGIEAIKNIEKAIKMAEKKGNKVSDKTIAKIKANDKWVVGEIIDFIEDDNENDDNMPFEEEEIIDEIDLDDDSPKEGLGKGIKIEGELELMFKSGRKEWEANDIKQTSKLIFDSIYETYHQSHDENGIETTRYSLIETTPQVFTLKKK